MSLLEDLIRQEIEERGPIPFRRFMELALYHPELGYYASGQTRVGAQGDFITNVSVGPLFGRMLARYFASVWEELGRPEPFDLVEIGGSAGQLYSDVLRSLREMEPDLREKLRCTIVEPFPKLRDLQQRQLQATSYELPMRWVTNLQELRSASIQGVIWSNELFDALPVHRVKKFPSGWAELYVKHDQNGFSWTSGNPTYDPQDLPAGFPRGADLPNDYITEVWPHAEFWMSELARVLARGQVLTIDYGFEAAELYAEHRKEGTLQAYHAHKRSPDLLGKIGEQDLTAHVNFTGLIDAGKKFGLRARFFATQERFLMNVAKTMTPEDFTAMSPSEKKQFNTLVHPEMLGTVFKVLVQEK